MQNSKLRSLRHQFNSRLNAHSQTDWAIEEQAKTLNSIARPYDQWAFSPFDPTAGWLLYIYIKVWTHNRHPMGCLLWGFCKKNYHVLTPLHCMWLYWPTLLLVSVTPKTNLPFNENIDSQFDYFTTKGHNELQSAQCLLSLPGTVCHTLKLQQSFYVDGSPDPLTHLPLVRNICISELGQHWFR